MSGIRRIVLTEHPEIEELYEKLKLKLNENGSPIDDSVLDSAFEMALSAHRNQMRETGEPYIIHPLEVAIICAGLNMDKDSIIASLLHDTVEDTPLRLTRIEEKFGSEVARKVDALTKIRRIDLFARFSGRTMSDEQARNLQKLFLATAQDFSVLVIKIADRLHNLRTAEAIPADRLRRKAMETMDYYVPLARRLGLQEIATELEDLCFRILYPSEYEWIANELNEFHKTRSSAHKKMVENLRRALEEGGIKVARCFGRLKTPYSAWKKVSTQKVPLEQVFDLLAIRVIIRGDELDCYKALGIIHGLYRPIFNRFRDFIAAPKINGYQSLHTTIAGENGQITEVQIRTEWMDEVAERGIAAHWKYKGKSEQARLRETFSWFNFIEDLSQDVSSSEEFVEKARESLAKEDVLVLTPQGEVISLPKGSTPLDFAYYIHTELGHSTASAKVNGVTVPLDYELKMGDVVEIIKNDKNVPEPQAEWLNMVKSPKSIVKIKKWFRNRPRKERVEIGRYLLRAQIEREGLYPLNLMEDSKLLDLLKQFGIKKIDDLFDEIIAGKLMASQVVDALKSSYVQKMRKIEKKASAYTIGEPAPLLIQAPVGLASEFAITLSDGTPLRRKVQLMYCCTPVFGEPIVGVNNRIEHRVEIHRDSCPYLKANADLELVLVQWSKQTEGLHYPAAIYISGLNRVGLLYDVLGKLSELGVNLVGGNLSLKPTISQEDQSADFELVIEVLGVEQLSTVIKAISSVNDVIAVERVFHFSEKESSQGKKTRK